MKKLIMFMLSIFTMVAFTACGSSSSASTSQAAPSNADKQSTAAAAPASNGNSKILVAYFSPTGNTKALAENAASVLGADTYEIVPEKKYTSNDLNYNDETTRATVEQKNDTARPAINGKVNAFEKYDTVVLAYPIWWGQAPRIMNTFVEGYDFTGRKIIPICTSASSDIGSSAEVLHKLSADKGNWEAGKRFAKGTDKTELKAWFASHNVQAGK